MYEGHIYHDIVKVRQWLDKYSPLPTPSFNPNTLEERSVFLKKIMD